MKPYYEHAGVTIYHGDCLEVLGTLAPQSADLVLTDPPYGIDYQSARRTDSQARLPKIRNDKQPFIWWLPGAKRITKDSGSLVCFCRWDVQEAFRLAIEWAGYDLKSQLVWDRQSHGMGDLAAAFAPQHDVAWFAVGDEFEFPGKRPKSIIRAMRLSGANLLHPNEKPCGLMGQLIEATTSNGGCVVDAFMGSGATLLAAKQLGRQAIGIELEERYCEIAARRLSQEVMDLAA